MTSMGAHAPEITPELPGLKSRSDSVQVKHCIFMQMGIALDLGQKTLQLFIIFGVSRSLCNLLDATNKLMIPRLVSKSLKISLGGTNMH